MLKRVGPVILLLVMLLLGAGLGYATGVSSVQINSTGLWQLHPSYQGFYVQAVADAYAKDSGSPAAVARATERLSYLCQRDDGLKSAIAEAQKYYQDEVSRANLAQLDSLVESGQVKQSTQVQVCVTTPIESWTPIAQWAWVGILLAAIGIVAYGVLQIVRANDAGAGAPAGAAVPISGVAAPAGAAAGERGKATVPAAPKPPIPVAGAKSVAQAGAKISASIEKTDFTTAGVTPPIVQFMTTYLHGDDLYDDSFSIETASGDFLGETGMGISETLPAPGEAKKVTAFEVWLFDKNDIRTVTKVIMSDYAFNDDAIRAKLAPKGEAVMAKAGDKISLETASLRIQARVVDLAYGSGATPANGFFERITIELAAWKREGTSSPAGAPASGSTPSGLPNI